MSAITVLTGSSQLSSLLRAKKDTLVVIDFHATWCGPCKAIAPVYERLSNTYRGVTFCKVDVDAAQDIAKEYRVSAMPTFVFIKGGNKVDEVKGANAAALEAAIKKHSGGAASSGSAFPGSGHSLSGEKVAAAPAGPSSLPNLRLIALVVAVFGLWYYYGSNVDMDVPESGGGFY